MTPKKQLQFQSMELLDALVRYFREYDSVLKGSDVVLQPAFDELLRAELVSASDKVYKPTKRGRAAVKCFLERKQDCQCMLTVYSSVDVEAGEFAWETQLEDLSKVPELLSEDRWLDLRLAVAEFKGLDLDEVAFLIRSSFNWDGVNWQKDLMEGEVWNEISEFHRRALKVSDLNFEDWEGKIDGKDVIASIIKSGARILQAQPQKEPPPRLDKSFDVIAPRAMSKTTLENYLKASYVHDCWNVDLATGKTHSAPQEFYWK